MNPHDGQPDRAACDDEALDLLVDGELDEARRRAVLARLDDQPGAWRRLALAFLEAQCWKREMRSMAFPAKAAPPAARPTPRRRWLEGRAATALAMAASFLLALGLGTFLRDLATRSGDDARGPSRLADGGAPPKAPGAAPGERPDPRWPHVPGRGGADSPWQLVTVGTDQGPDGTRRVIQVPACERPSIDDAWLGSFPPPMPEEVEEALRRAGHDVRQSRQLVPLKMPDGRQLVVPVDQVEVHNVGRKRDFQ